MTEPARPVLRPRRRLLIGGAIAAGAVLALSGCKGQSAGQSDAPVPVLTGTASDAMLPLDTVTSQPPLDPRAARSDRAGAGDPDAAGTEPAADSAAPDAALAPAPAPAAAPAKAAPAGPAE